jgi:methylglutaconyl-CoA hydratase
LKKAASYSYEENLRDTQNLVRLFALMNECPKPLVGVIHGAAIGGGVGLVSVCDIALATRDTRFGLSEVRLGVIPACVGPFVIAKIGPSHARHLFLSGERFTAEKAAQAGLIHELCEDRDSLEAALERVLENLLQAGSNAMSVAKKLVLDLSWPERRAVLPDCLEHVSKMLADQRLTSEGQEGMNAFLEKRKPSWLVERD